MNLAQQTLWPDEVTPSDPKQAEERFDWYALFCQEKYQMPPDWEIYSWKANGKLGEPGCFTLVEGGVFKQKITKGKRKGRTDYKKPEPGTLATLSILQSNLEQFQIDWEAKTGKCHKCYGTGLDWYGWSAGHGNRYKQCRRCSPSAFPRPE